MKTIQLVQGTPDWHAHRKQHRNASDTPAVLGVSPYKSRSQLLHERHTGITPDTDQFTQQRYDAGHRAEALARPLAEEIVGDDLYPVVGVDGPFSASFDGLTMDSRFGFEHKLLNEDLRSVLWREGVTGASLPEHYRAQMEHQLMVSGAEAILFMASEWTEGGELIEELHTWYTTDRELRDRIVAAWEQFERDLADYKPPVVAEKAQADVIMDLPTLAIQIRGEVVASNLPAFKKAAEHFIAKINTDLKTDSDFANAEATVKFCADAEERLELAKQQALSQTASIDELMRTVDFIKEQLRAKRLDLNKKVTARKAEIKGEIVAAAQRKYREHVAALEAELEGMRLALQLPDFDTASKNKRTIATLQDAVDNELAKGKIDADLAARGMREKLAWFNVSAADHRLLFADLQLMIHKPIDDFKMSVDYRIEAHKKAEEEKARRIAAQQAAHQAALAEQARKQAEQQPQQQAAANVPPWEEQPAAAAVPVGLQVAEVRQVAAAPSNEAATLKLGTICERLGFTVTAAFVGEVLGVPHSATDKAARLWRESDFARICQALRRHIAAIEVQQHPLAA
jgi:putative phage-type endonuclease